MKRLIMSIAAIAMIFGSASCQKDPSLGKGETNVSFNVVVPDEVVTKAISDGLKVDQLVWEVYDGTERVYNGTLNQSSVSKGNTQFVLDLMLLPGNTYDLLFWAQKGSDFYDTSNLKAVSLKAGSYTANDDDRDAFYGSCPGSFADESYLNI